MNQNYEKRALKDPKVAFYSRNGNSNKQNISDSKDSRDLKHRSENFSNGNKRQTKNNQNKKDIKQAKYWDQIDDKSSKLHSKEKWSRQPRKRRNKRKQAYLGYKRNYNDGNEECLYVKKQKANDSQKKDQITLNSQSRIQFEKFELKDFQEFYVADAESHHTVGKARSRSLSSGRSSNRSSMSEDALHSKPKSLSPKTRQKIIEESKEYLLQPKKFYNLKFHKKIELIRNSPKKIAREFYKIDYQHKFLTSMNRYFKKHPGELKKFNIPLDFNQKGDIEPTSSYYVLLNSIDFFTICRHCQINSFDAARDVKKVVAQKISLMVKKIRIHEHSLGKEECEKNLRFNRNRSRSRSMQRVPNRLPFGQPMWLQNA